MKSELEILLVEDDPDTRTNLCDILEIDGHRVFAAGSAAEARGIAGKETVYLVILDHKLPDATAGELLPELKALLPDAQVIVVTGYADMDSTISAFRGGAADYILKPINPDALRNSIKRISHQRQMERELQQKHEFAELVLSTAEAVVLILDLNGTIVRFNPYFERVFGWTQEELEGRDWFDSCIPERDHDRIREVFLMTAHHIDTSGVINPVVTKSGEQRQIRWSNTTLKDETGEATAVLAVGVDVTEFLEAQTRASQAERLAAIGQTMTALAHESRNALQRIHAGLELLELDLEDRPDALGDVNKVRRAAKDLNDLLEEVRSYAAPIRLHRETSDIPTVYQRAWRNLTDMRGNRDIEVMQHCCHPPATCLLDVLRMEQVFRNLFENSLAACEDPVRIEVSCAPLDERWIQVTVSDNGPGLTAEQCASLFEPFYTTKASGTGLGMSIAKRIVEAHRGTIEITDPNDRTEGASFTIRLPIDVPADDH